MAGSLVSHLIDLPSNFSKLKSVDGDTALISVTRPLEAGESRPFLKDDVEIFSLVHKDSFENIRTFPRLPGQFPDAVNVKGLGHVFSINDHPRSCYYITEDAYKRLGNPSKTSGGQRKWPKLDGFVFLGGQMIQSENHVYLHVDGADAQSPTFYS